MDIDKKTLEEIALSEKEYEKIIELLGRSPNHVELGLFGANTAGTNTLNTLSKHYQVNLPECFLNQGKKMQGL